MESSRGLSVLWWMTAAALAVTGALCQLPPPQLVKVGETAQWKPGVNYTKWAAQHRFYVGYWLLFNFDKHMYNVLEVNQTNYAQCNDKNFITNITKGGRDVFNLTQARPYYFLSSGGYCYQGMKLAINVEEYVATVPAPAPAKNGGSAIIASPLVLFAVFGITVAWAFLLKLY